MDEPKRKIVFISYAHEQENPAHSDWVRELADGLRKIYGIIVLLDQYELIAGKPLTNFMIRSLEQADKVLIVGTPVYKMKANAAKGGVGFEHSLISEDLYRLQENNDKYIPILRRGNKAESFPGYIGTLMYFSMVDDDMYEVDLYKLARIISDKPEHAPPELGPIVDFTTIVPIDPVLTIGLKLKRKEEEDKRKETYLYSQNAVEQANRSAQELINLVEEKVNQYTEAKVLKVGFSKSGYQDLINLGVLYTDTGYQIIFRWDGNNCRLDAATLRISYYKGDVHHKGNTTYLDSFNPQYAQDNRFTFEVDDALKTVWRDKASQEIVDSEKLVQNVFLWVLSKVDEIIKIKRQQRL